MAESSVLPEASHRVDFQRRLIQNTLSDHWSKPKKNQRNTYINWEFIDVL